jgi:hypothetical protein
MIIWPQKSQRQHMIQPITKFNEYVDKRLIQPTDSWSSITSSTICSIEYGPWSSTITILDIRAIKDLRLKIYD